MGLVTERCIVVSHHISISILSMLVEPLEMLYADVALWAGDLKAEDLSLTSNVCLQEIKFILNLVLLLAFPWEPCETWTK